MQNTRTKRTFALTEFLLKINLLLENYLLLMTETSEVHQFQQRMEKMDKNSNTKQTIATIYFARFIKI